MVSGFLSYKMYRWEDFLPFLKKKIMRLLVPWICTFEIIYLVRGSMGYWFLLCLFQISIIGFLLIVTMKSVNRKAYWMMDVCLLGLIYLILRYFHIQNIEIYGLELGHFVDALLPFGVGILLRKYNPLFSICIEQSWFYTCGFMAFIFIFISRYLLDYGTVFELVYRYSSIILAILGSLLVFHAFAKNNLFRLQTILSYLGKKTLPIYILHIALVAQLPEVGEFILRQNAITSITVQLVYSIILSGIAIIFSLMLYKFIAISPLLRRMLFGE